MPHNKGVMHLALEIYVRIMAHNVGKIVRYFKPIPTVSSEYSLERQRGPLSGLRTPPRFFEIFHFTQALQNTARSSEL